ncbi:MAG: hypothetical protein AB4050_03850 [Synechococcus sp.]
MFFWAKPAESSEWVEIPASGGLLVAGKYNIAVQSPQPHFTIVSHLRQYCRQDNGVEILRWQTEHSSRTNGEGVGWIAQDLELTAGRWQISCRDADLVAELFGENSDNSITFQVIDLKGARLSSGPYEESSVTLPAMTSSTASIKTVTTASHLSETGSPPSSTIQHDLYSQANDAGGASIASSGADKHTGWKEREIASTAEQVNTTDQPAETSAAQFPSSQHHNSDDAVTEIFTPTNDLNQEFALNRSEFTAFPGETIEISGYSKQSGQLTITALTQNSTPIQVNQRLTVPSSTSLTNFSVQLKVPETWSEDAIIGVAELHPDSGSASLAQDFTVSAEPNYSQSPSTTANSSEATEHSPAIPQQFAHSEEEVVVDPTLPIEQPDVFVTIPPQASSRKADAPTVTPDITDTDIQSLSNAQLTKAEPRSPKPRLAHWNPELTDEDIQLPEIAFASSRSPDRTLHRLLALVQSSVAATAARTRFQQVRSASPSLDSGMLDGIVGDVKVVPATDVTLVGTVLPLNGLGTGGASPETADRLDSAEYSLDRFDNAESTEPSDPSASSTGDVTSRSGTISPQTTNDELPVSDESPAIEPNSSWGTNIPAAADRGTMPASAISNGTTGARPKSSVTVPLSANSASTNKPQPSPTHEIPSPSTDSRSMDSPSANDVQSSALSIDIPQSLRSGDLVSVVMKSKATPHPACVKLWVINAANQTVVDGPRWILDFSADGDIRTGITHLTVPSRVQSLQFQACAYHYIPSDIEEDSDAASPVATATVHRSVSPRSTPYR